MPTTYKVLGQSNPAATTATTAYTVPSATNTVVSTLSVCNLSTTPATYRIAVRPAGASLTAAQYIVYDASLSSNETIALTLGLTLAATDVVTVYASTANVSFSLFGSEIA
jgi:hypothetical protein